jgi:hypothetical protein
MLACGDMVGRGDEEGAVSQPGCVRVAVQGDGR